MSGEGGFDTHFRGFAIAYFSHHDDIRVRAEKRAVILAPPGAGKTTRIPPALVKLGPTILLQPRRVAARALARRIATERGWTIGNEIGWQIRFERRFTERTQLLVATEGILTARLQAARVHEVRELQRADLHGIGLPRQHGRHDAVDADRHGLRARRNR